MNDPIEDFVALSSRLTGFTRAELYGTGMIMPYWRLLQQIGGDSLVGRMLTLGGSDAAIAAQLLPDPDTGPLARNLTTLWYLGLWNQLPLAWRDVHGAHALDVTQYPSPEAYTQGLVWLTFHGHPQGAHPQGYGSWALPPLNEASP